MNFLDRHMDRLLSLGMVAGIALLAFVLGVAALYFEFAPARFIKESIEGGQAIMEQQEEIAIPDRQQGDVNFAINHSKIPVFKTDKAFIGPTLLSLRYSNTAYLVSMHGTVLHRWDIPFSKVWPSAPHIQKQVPDRFIYIRMAKLFPNGDLLVLYEAVGDSPYGYGMVKIDKKSQILWTYEERTHHGFSIAKDGTIHVLAHRYFLVPQPNLEKLPYPTLADFIVTLTPEGKETRRISVVHAFLGTPYEQLLYHHSKNSAIWDHFHSNSIEQLEESMAPAFPMFKPGYLLISLRNMNTIAVIDPDTQKVVWAYNGIWKAQHTAHFTAQGRILLLDNKGYSDRSTPYSRVLEINPATNGIEWSYTGSPTAPFFTEAYGDVERLPNGNTLIAEAYNSRVFEITSEGEVVWAYKLPNMKQRNLDEAEELEKKKEQFCRNPYYEELLDPNNNINAVITSATRYRAEDLTFLPK